MESIGQRIIFFRQKEGLNQRAFSQCIGIPVTTIADFEKDRALPGAKFLLTLKKHFPYINLDWLLCGNGKILINDIDETDMYTIKNVFLEIQKLSSKVDLINEQLNCKKN